MVAPNDPVFSDPSAVAVLRRFVQLWESCWTDPNDTTHTYIEFYHYAKLIAATENNIQEDIACFLLKEFAARWRFDDEYDGVDEDEIDPDWLKLKTELFEFVDG